MERSENIGALAGALAKAQGQFRQPKKTRDVKVQTKTGGSYTFKYAELDEILDCVRKPLSENGLAVMQLPTIHEGWIEIKTLIVHDSGEWLSEVMSCRPEAMELQKLGGAITYLRRYSLQSILGLAADDDDDGNAASGNQAVVQQRDKAVGPAAKKPPASKAPPRQQETHRTALPEVADEPAAQSQPPSADPPAALPSVYDQALRVCQTVGSDKVKGVPDRISGNTKLSDAQKHILRGFLEIRKVQLNLGGNEEDPKLYLSARGASVASSGEKLDQVASAIAIDTRLTEEERAGLFEMIATRREMLASGGAM